MVQDILFNNISMANLCDLVIDEITGMYMRTCGTQREEVSAKISALYPGCCHMTQMVTSGMNAIYLALSAVQNHTNKTFMFADELYCDTTTRIVKHITDNGGTCVTFDQTNIKGTEILINKIRKENISCIFFESCSNPSGKLIDWKIIKLLPLTTYIVVDNTWLSPILCNPFDYGAHIVVESCTKYLSAGKCVAGHISFLLKQDPVTRNVINLIKTQGIHVSPISCDIISNQLDTLEYRIKTASLKTLIIYEKIKDNNKISDIKVPFEMLTKWTTKWITSTSGSITTGYVPSIILFSVKSKSSGITRKMIQKLVEATGLHFETSYGKNYNKIDSFPTIKKDTNTINNENSKASDIFTTVWLRLSIGYDENEPNDVLTLEKQLNMLIKNI
jgi:cystathionine beta-lyase/cystathionine gamma-synthase